MEPTGIETGDLPTARGVPPRSRLLDGRSSRDRNGDFARQVRGRDVSRSGIARKAILEEGFADEPLPLAPPEVRPPQVEADAAEERERRGSGQDDVLSGEH